MTVPEFNQLLYTVISENDFDLATNFLRSPETQRATAIWFILKLLQNSRSDQAGFASYLVAEFVPSGTPVGVVELLRRHEFQMYRRLKLRCGIEKSLRRYLSMSPEGRALLKSLGDGGLLDA